MPLRVDLPYDSVDLDRQRQAYLISLTNLRQHFPLCFMNLEVSYFGILRIRKATSSPKGISEFFGKDNLIMGGD